MEYTASNQQVAGKAALIRPMESVLLERYTFEYLVGALSELASHLTSVTCSEGSAGSKRAQGVASSLHSSTGPSNSRQPGGGGT